jgi:hypothetical protein
VPSTPTERSLAAQMAAHALHAQVADPSAHTAPARKAALERFERQVDPEGLLSPGERARRAEHARKSYFLKLALLSAQVRRKKARMSTGEATAATPHPGSPPGAQPAASPRRNHERREVNISQPCPNEAA